MKNTINTKAFTILLTVLLISCKGDDDNATPLKSDAKQITGFVFSATDNTALESNITATVNETDKTISAAVPYGTDVTALIPEITISAKASASPEGEQDFSTQVDYIVTAEDGSKATYEATVSITPNDEKQILSFQFLADDNETLDIDIIAEIDEENKTITASVPNGTDITSLLPAVEISAGASLLPEGSQDFSSAVNYTVTADDTSIASYTVNISESLSQRDILIALYEANPDNTLNWPIDEEDISTWEGVTTDENGNIIELDFINFRDGDNYYGFSVVTIIPEIGDLLYLQKLSLSGNEDLTIPEEIRQLKALKELYLSEALDQIPIDILELSSLEILDLSRNNIASLPDEIGQLSNLTYLNLNNNNLEFLPSTIGQLTKLNELHLESNNLNTVPSEIGQLQNLNYLRLSANSITSIPDEIGNIVNLSSLSLDGNSLNSLPDGIGQLSNLEGINLTNNLFTSFPEQLLMIESLSTIRLINNSLNAIPADINNLSNLYGLDLSYNDFTVFPSEILDIQSISQLYLNNNNISEIPSEIGNLINLGRFEMNTNSLTSLPPEIGFLTQLTNLELEENNLISLPTEIGNLTSLRRVDLDNNALESLPVEMGQLVNLYHLSLTDNDLTSIPQEICDLDITFFYVDVPCEGDF